MAHLRLVFSALAISVAASHALPLLIDPQFISGSHPDASFGFALPPQPSGFVSPPSFASRSLLQQQGLAHREVVAASEDEARLPPNLRNPFYRNPRIGAALAKESWFINGEMEVRQREADKIPRTKIFSILKNAGFV